MRLNKRTLIDAEDYDLHPLHKMMTSLFPKKNDCASQEGLGDVRQELVNFNKKTITPFS